MRRSLLALACLLLALNGCTKNPADETVHRDGEPDVVRVSGEDTEMAGAIRKARDSVETFRSALKSPAANQSKFSVKKAFREGTKVEHIWLTDVSLDGETIRGRVGNDPIDIKQVKLGDETTVAPNELSDWFLVDNGKLVGGYTIRVLYKRMSAAEKKGFDENADFKLD